MQLVNLSGEDWENVEIWINRQYVVFVPRIASRSERAKTLNFQMFYDDKGHYFPVDNNSPNRMIRQLEMVQGGQVYRIPFTQAD